MARTFARLLMALPAAAVLPLVAAVDGRCRAGTVRARLRTYAAAWCSLVRGGW